MRVAEIWRYPVKSLAGERLERCTVAPDGIPGDRIAHVAIGELIVTARARRGLLALRGGVDPEGEPTIDGLRWSDPRARDAIKAAILAEPMELLHGAPLRIERTSEGAFDVLPLHVVTTGAAAAHGIGELRRLRPNLVVETPSAELEASWVGRRLAIGEAVIEAVRLRPRCVVTTIDPDTGERDATVLRQIASRARAG
ncbi:MAG: MOSC domain-containing protein [Gaiellales bacterium]